MIKKTLRLFIKAYKLIISPYLAPACRFHPTCSTYADEALEAHGVVRGFWLSVWRVLRCQPFSAGGYDPVPKFFSVKNSKNNCFVE